MMIVKLDDGTFNVYDVLGDLGIWNFEQEGLEQYLHLLKRSRSRFTGVKGFPLMESLYGFHASGAVKEEMGDDPLLQEVLEEGFPLKCFFDTDIVLRNADQWGPGIINPPSISIDVNNLCNFACRWCCVDVLSRSSKGLLSPEEIAERIIRPITDTGNLTWYLVGGEPGLTPERTAAIAGMIRKITSDISDERPFIALDTNGTNFVRYADLYQDSGINTIQFSLSAADAERDRYFRRTPQNIDSVEMVKEAVRAAKDRGLHCGINMVVWKDSEGQSNAEEIEGVMDIASSLKMDFLRVTPAVSIGAAISAGSGFTREEMRGIGKKLSTLAQKKGKGETKIVSLFPLAEDQGHDDRPLICRAGTCFVHVDHEGNLFPCTMVMPHFHAGNVRQKDIRELWRSSETLREWRQVAEISESCASCNDRGYCVSRCPAYAWAAFKTITMEESPVGCR